MNNIFEIDWAQFVRQWTHPKQRLAPLLQLLESLVAGIAQLHTDLLEYIEQKRRELSYNSQTLLFEACLNDTFDPLLRRIYITNNSANNPRDFAGLNYEYALPGAPPRIFGKLHGDTSTPAPPPWFPGLWQEYVDPVGFIVHVPQAYQPQHVAIDTKVKQYKFASIKHTIQYLT